MTYAVRLSSRAQRDFSGLDRQIQRRVLQKLEELRKAPSDPRLSKPLHAHKGLRSARVGDWRIVFEVVPELAGLHVDRIRHRSDVYSHLS